MSKLSTFLHPVTERREKEVVISDRFQEDGKPAPFKIRSVTQEENDALVAKCRKTRRVNGQPTEFFDSAEYSRRLVVLSTLEPDFSSTEMCEAYGTMNPLEVPGKMLFSGEFQRLVAEISGLSGFTDSDAVVEAKN